MTGNANDTFKQVWESVVEEAPDGSGDALIPVPDELLQELGWTTDTELNVDVYPDAGTIVIRAIQ